MKDLIAKTPAAAIERALTWIDERWGSTPDYLRSGDLTEDELVALRARLTA